MYISRFRKTRYQIASFLQLLFGGFFGLVTLVGIGDMITDVEEAKTYWDVNLFFLIEVVLLLYCGIRNRIIVSSCNAFDEAFQKDGDGVVDIREISLRTGMKEEVVIKRLRLLLRKKCLIHVSVNFEGNEPEIILEDHNASLHGKQAGKEYMLISCPNCGGSSKVKAGVVAKCRYCGGYIKAESEA